MPINIGNISVRVVQLEPGAAPEQWRERGVEHEVSGVLVESEEETILILDRDGEPWVPEEIHDQDAFDAYFDCADELDATDAFGVPVLTLNDLDLDFRATARVGAERMHLPWPPSLADAEEYQLDHPEIRSTPFMVAVRLSDDFVMEILAEHQGEDT